jgi:hypothetical protein
MTTYNGSHSPAHKEEESPFLAEFFTSTAECKKERDFPTFAGESPFVDSFSISTKESFEPESYEAADEGNAGESFAEGEYLFGTEKTATEEESFESGEEFKEQQEGSNVEVEHFAISRKPVAGIAAALSPAAGLYLVASDEAVHEDITKTAARFAGLPYDNRLENGCRWPDVPCSKKNKEGVEKPDEDSVATSYDNFLKYLATKKSGTLAYRSHQGDLQFWHSMALSGSGTNQQVRDKILNQIGVWYEKGRLDVKNGLFHVGRALHTIQDSFSRSHTWRAEGNQNDPPVDIPYRKPLKGEILSFQDYNIQNHETHRKYDVKSAPGYDDALAVSIVMLKFLKKKAPFYPKVYNFLLNRVYVLAPGFDSKPAGLVPDEFKRKIEKEEIEKAEGPDQEYFTEEDTGEGTEEITNDKFFELSGEPEDKMGYGEVTAEELEDLVTVVTPFQREDAPTAPAGSPAEQFNEAYYQQQADELYKAMKGLGTDEEKIYNVLSQFAGAFGRIRKLKEAYRQRVDGTTIDSLEEALRDDMSGAELDKALQLLHGSLQPTGFAKSLLAEAERDPSPRGACTVASIKRYMRAYLDYKHLGGMMGEAERLRKVDSNSVKYAEAKQVVRQKLSDLLGATLGNEYLEGGPNPKDRVGQIIASTLIHPNILDKVKGRRFYRLWQVYQKSEEFAQGAVRALAETGLGTKVTSPGTGNDNIKDLLWEEILKPGAIIQIWSTVDATKTFTCPQSKRFVGVCGHSFIFVEYVYSAQNNPPQDNPSNWIIYGGSGIPLSTGGEVLSSQRAPLTEMKNLFLVGMRIVDQWGYHFIPITPSYINNKILPEHIDRVRWLHGSEVWFAAQVA